MAKSNELAALEIELKLRQIIIDNYKERKLSELELFFKEQAFNEAIAIVKEVLNEG